MTSTSVFFGSGSTMTIHMPQGAVEAVFMIEGLDSVASITLPLDEVRRLMESLQGCTQPRSGFPHAVDAGGDSG